MRYRRKKSWSGRRTLGLVLWAACLLAAVAEPAGARTRHRSVARPPAAPPPAGPLTLQSAIEREVALGLKGTAAMGVHVIDLASGDTVYAYSPDETRVIASNTKLLTAAAAVEALGPGFFFETRFVQRGTLKDGVLTGDLGVVGGGDPNISGRAFDGDSFAVFRGWARDLKARGVRRVSGDLYLATGLFEARQIHPDWPRSQLSSWYEAPIAALSFNDNCILVRVSPASRAGLPVTVETVPPVNVFHLEVAAQTVTAKRRQKLAIHRSGDQLYVGGSMALGSAAFETWVTVPDPVAYFGTALAGVLAAEGIEVAGRLHPVERLPNPVWERVAVYRSDLVTALRATLKHSQNYYAETLLKQLAARRCGEGSWRAGIQAVSEFLTSIGVPSGSFSMVDGSGLSRGNRFTPRHLTTLLRYMFYRPAGTEFARALPYAGEAESSLRHRLTQPPYAGNVSAKTGTIEGVSALSGYAKSLLGKYYAFSILMNRTRGSWDPHRVQDRIVMALIDHG